MTYLSDVDRYMMNRMNQVFGDFFGRKEQPAAMEIEFDTPTDEQFWPYNQRPLPGWSHFKIDMIEDDKNVVVYAELPGILKENIQVQIDEGVLTIQAERKQIEPAKGKTHVRECSFGLLRRSVKLPEYTVTDSVRTNFEYGVLTLFFPKNPDKETKRMIKIA